MKCFEEIIIIQVSRCECERQIQLSQPNVPDGFSNPETIP
jgi:hypothetical protein